MQKNITIKDVARISGFSTQTISRVINNDENVKDKTREKILKIIEECGYKPNFYAKSLVSKKNKNILILLKRKSGHKATIWTNTLVNEIILKNTRSDISILVEQYYKDEKLEKSLISKASTFIDGAIIFYEEKDDERIKLLKKNNIPFIIFGKSYDEKNICVGNDDLNCCYKATKYIIKNIGEKIVFVTGESLPMNEQRIEGLVKAYIETGADINNLKIERHINNSSEIKEVVRKYRDNLPECFFVNGDEKAIVLMRELFDYGIKVPDNVAIMGFDNLPFSEYTIPALSTISLNYKRLAESLLKKIISLAEGGDEITEEIESELIIRESTGYFKEKAN